ncbi:MAG TPA: DUF1003 domain-containing protein [Blastocatellia bacterium]|nr:DUF1003 domain-containing protein [Blastocatellia bacterium]
MFETELGKLNATERAVVEKFISRAKVTRHVDKEFRERLTFGQRVADYVAATMGGWRFIIIQSILLTFWLILNVTAFIRHWDPYPFILLNLALSFQAAYAAPVIMMSQNRQSEKDRLQSTNDYEVNIKAELEILALHEKFDELRERRWEDLVEMQRRQIELLEQLLVKSNPDFAQQIPERQIR